MSQNNAPTVIAPHQGMNEAARAQLQAELAHRFRHTMRTGQVSPLLHLVLRYKQEAAPCTAPT